MRVAVIKRDFVSLTGGTERYAEGLIMELRRRDCAVEILTSRWALGDLPAGVTMRQVPIRRGPGFMRQLSFALNCRRIVRDSNCDIVFSLQRTIFQDIVRAGGGCHVEWLRQRALRMPALRRLTVAANPLHLVLHWLERRTFSPANTGIIIANSHRGKDEIIRHYAFPEQRIFVVHNGVDCQRFKPAPRTDRDGFILLFVGSGFERKGLEFAIRALAKLPPHARLRVAGKGKRAPHVELAKKLNLANRVEFLGTGNRIEDVYAGADVLVHPAIYEPFSNACLEAMACGLPVVTSRINGASEVVVPGKNGQVVEDPRDIVELARSLEPYLDPVSRASAGAAARRTAETMTMVSNVEQTLAIFEMFRAHPEWRVRQKSEGARV